MPESNAEGSAADRGAPVGSESMAEGTRIRKQRVAADRPAAPSVPSARELALAVRVATLESRVAELERLLKSAPATVAEAPEPERPVKARPRCPGCHIEVDAITRGRCPWCGFLFEAVAQLRRAAKSRAR